MKKIALSLLLFLSLGGGAFSENKNSNNDLIQKFQDYLIKNDKSYQAHVKDYSTHAGYLSDFKDSESKDIKVINIVVNTYVIIWPYEWTTIIAYLNYSEKEFKVLDKIDEMSKYGVNYELYYQYNNFIFFEIRRNGGSGILNTFLIGIKAENNKIDEILYFPCETRLTFGTEKIDCKSSFKFDQDLIFIKQLADYNGLKKEINLTLKFFPAVKEYGEKLVKFKSDLKKDKASFRQDQLYAVYRELFYDGYMGLQTIKGNENIEVRYSIAQDNHIWHCYLSEEEVLDLQIIE